MTFLSAKLKSAGYRTVHAGKWHLGMSSWGHIPAGRGFDESLVFFAGAEDHLTQRSCTDGECIIPINDTSGSPHDWWQNSSPARATAGSRHSGFQLNDFAVKAVLDHEPDVQPLFMYLAPASSHTPLEPPERFANLYPLSWYEDRRLYAGQCSVWDEILGNVTSALMSKQMWSRTLLVFSSDNGGPVYWSSDPSFPHGAGANNWPLLGGKASNWEGGVRAAAFVSGGILAASLRGTTTSAYVHIADWYATFCELAGVDPTDHVAAKYGLPPIDSLSMVQLISSTNGTSPRQEIPISLDWVDGKAGSSANASALTSRGHGSWFRACSCRRSGKALSFQTRPTYRMGTLAKTGSCVATTMTNSSERACTTSWRTRQSMRTSKGRTPTLWIAWWREWRSSAAPSIRGRASSTIWRARRRSRRTRASMARGAHEVRAGEVRT